MWATHNSIGHRLTVCAQTLSVRHSAGGPAFGTLTAGQTFLVEDVGPYEFANEYVYGYAYGNVGAHGWVQNGWFCNGT